MIGNAETFKVVSIVEYSTYMPSQSYRKNFYDKHLKL